MDKVIVSALLIIASITAATITINVIGVGLDRGGTSLVQSQRDAAHRIQSGITIISAGYTDEEEEILNFWLKGSGNVVIKPLSSFDVFLRRGDGTWGEYIPYSDGEADGTWTPVPFTQTLNPRETLEIEVSLKLNPGVHVLSVATPEGVTAKYVFEVPVS